MLIETKRLLKTLKDLRLVEMSCLKKKTNIYVGQGFQRSLVNQYIISSFFVQSIFFSQTIERPVIVILESQHESIKSSKNGYPLTEPKIERLPIELLTTPDQSCRHFDHCFVNRFVTIQVPCAPIHMGNTGI